MARTPQGALNRINTLASAWETLRSTKTFSGLTLDQYREAIKPSLDVREELAELDRRTQAAIARREAADTASLLFAQRIVNAVKSDPEEGEDGEVYEAMGYVRKSVRSSGLTRRRVNGEANKEVKPGET